MRIRRYIPAAMFVLAVAFGCQDKGGPASPNPLPSFGGGESTSATTVPSSSTPTVDAEPATGIEACGLAIKPANSSGVMNADGKITATVGADYSGAGNVWIYLWDPDVNAGTEYGPFPANQQFSFTPGEVRLYKFRIAGEVDTDGDKRADANCQDDRFFLTVNPPNNPPPPPPPTCEERLTLQTTVDGEGIVGTLRDKKGNVVADKFFPKQEQAYTGYVCEGEFNNEVARALNNEKEGCCFPVQVPACVPSNSVVGPTWVHYSSVVYYYDLGQINDGDYPDGPDGNTDSDDDRERFCTDQGGDWLNNFNIPNDGEGTRSNVCRIGHEIDYNGPNSDDTINENDLYHTAGPSGIIADGSVNFVNKGGTARLFCGGVEKDVESIQLSCGRQGTVLLHYEHPTAHTNSSCTIQVTQ